jgi:acyl carrier protein
MKEIQLKKIICSATKIPLTKINEKLSSENNEKWDSLAQLHILSILDKKTNGKSAKINGLNQVLNYKKLAALLKKKKIIE